MRIPRPSCGVFLGYRVLHGGDFDIYLGCVQVIMKADLDMLVDFADEISPEMQHIFIYDTDSDELGWVYHRSNNTWGNIKDGQEGKASA